MSIFQRKERKDEWYVHVRLNGRRVRRRSPLQSLDGALAFEQELRVQFANELEQQPSFPLSSFTTFTEFSERWLVDYVSIANRKSTMHEKRCNLNARLLPAFGRLALGEITTNIVDARVAEWMRAGMSVKRVNNLLTTLRCALRCAAEWGIIRNAPLIRHHRYFPPVPIFLTSAESDRLLDSMVPGFWRTFVLFQLRTGVRFGEAAALQWGDLVLDSPKPYAVIRRGVALNIVSEPKTQASRRTIALTPDLVAALRAHRYRRPHGEWLFTSPTGRFYTPGGTSHFLKEACRKAGVPVVSWHKLRHSCASQLLAVGVPLVAVKELLGHTSLDVTSIYTHVSPNLMWEYVDRLSPGWTPGGRSSCSSLDRIVST